MANERMVPLLPCASIDEMRDFYLHLGFTVTYRQLKPNPYIAFRREGLELHYFGMDGFRPEDSYGSCLVLVDDTQPLFEVFAAGLRTRFGKLPMTGFPRLTRVEALGYLAELSVRPENPERADELFDAIDAVDLSEAQRESVESTLEQARELRDGLAASRSPESIESAGRSKQRRRTSAP